MNGYSFTNTTFNMKKFPAIALLAVMAILPQQRAAAQQEENTAQQVWGLILQLMQTDNQAPSPKKKTKGSALSIPGKKLLGVWRMEDGLLFIDKYGNLSTTTESYGTLVFSGKYEYGNNKLSIFDAEGSLVATWKVQEASTRLVLKDPESGKRVSYPYQCSVEEFYAQKDREKENRRANADRYVAQQQGYVLSRQIRNDINHSDTRRSYSHEAVQARENAKWYYGQGNTTQAKAWEQKAIELERDVQQLDRSHRN